jgi:hypothetical protein
MRFPIRTVLLTAVGAAALVAGAGAGAAPKPTCEIQPFEYNVVDVSTAKKRGGKFVFKALLEGMPTLTGANCPLDGRTVTTRGLVKYEWDVDFNASNVKGRYTAGWDLDNDGAGDVGFDAALRGSAAFDGETWMLDVEVNAQGPRSARLMLHQVAELDNEACLMELDNEACSVAVGPGSTLAARQLEDAAG